MNSIKSKKVTLLQLEYQVNEEVKTERYAMAFLSVYNNVRENKDTFLKMEMTYDSQVFITVKPEDEQVVVDWMKNFSDVWHLANSEKVERTVIQDYDDDFNEDILLTDKIDIYDLA